MSVLFYHNKPLKSIKGFIYPQIKGYTRKDSFIIASGREVGIPNEFYHSLRKLNPDFVLTRYPDVADGVPYELYDEEIALEKIRLAEEVLKWVEKELKK